MHIMLAFMVIIYLAGMTMTSHNTEQVIRIALALRFDNQELTEQIVQRKRIEAALRDSEERFRDFTESAADFFWELDAKFNFTDVSERFHEITGLWRPQVIGRDIEQILSRHCNDVVVVAEYTRLLKDNSERSKMSN